MPCRLQLCLYLLEPHYSSAQSAPFALQEAKTCPFDDYTQLNDESTVCKCRGRITLRNTQILVVEQVKHLVGGRQTSHCAKMHRQSSISKLMKQPKWMQQAKSQQIRTWKWALLMATDDERYPFLVSVDWSFGVVTTLTQAHWACTLALRFWILTAPVMTFQSFSWLEDIRVALYLYIGFQLFLMPHSWVLQVLFKYCSRLCPLFHRKLRRHWFAWCAASFLVVLLTT